MEAKGQEIQKLEVLNIFFFDFCIYLFIFLFCWQIKELTEDDLKQCKDQCFDKEKKIDYVLVYKDDHEAHKLKFQREDYLINLQTAGLELRLHVYISSAYF